MGYDLRICVGEPQWFPSDEAKFGKRLTLINPVIFGDTNYLPGESVDVLGKRPAPDRNLNQTVLWIHSV